MGRKATRACSARRRPDRSPCHGRDRFGDHCARGGKREWRDRRADQQRRDRRQAAPDNRQPRLHRVTAWAEVFDVNTMEPLRVTEAFLDHIARRTEAGGGMGSLVENTSGGSIAYRSSKAAVNMALRSTWHRQGSPVHPGRPRLGADRHGWRRRLDLARRKRLSPWGVIETFGPAQSGKFLRRP